jgi:hypothetical protein
MMEWNPASCPCAKRVVKYAVDAICCANQEETPGGRDGARPAKWVSVISILFIHVS